MTLPRTVVCGEVHILSLPLENEVQGKWWICPCPSCDSV